MASEKAPLFKRGEFHPSRRSDLRGPCPLCNLLFKIHSDELDNPPPGTARGELRDSDDINSSGEAVLNLDRFLRPGFIEHDVSNTRQDRASRDCCHRDPDVIQKRTPFDEQKRGNQQLDFTRKKHYVACLELAAFQCVFGKGLFLGVPVEYIEAVSGEDRLPFQGGWRPRRWWRAFMLEVIQVLLGVYCYAWSY
ncbi:hypothetical protein BDV59DRAFT_212102 [Aspergillus ambiguus]|uniref:putative peroxidase n=1 Tax=Aspergillus ambiguus TaxID=176160 RepID=UPI003CCD9EE0